MRYSARPVDTLDCERNTQASELLARGSKRANEYVFAMNHPPREFYYTVSTRYFSVTAAFFHPALHHVDAV